MGDRMIAGRYQLDSQLAAGPMSDVWRAVDLELERTVAIKRLTPQADRTRFEREARAAAALGHPHVVQVYDYGEAGGRPYMVLEFLPGGSLEQRLKGHPLPDGETRRLAAELAAGLAHAHQNGLIHRDLKPANILFDAEDRAKIADFGIARVGGAGTLTEAGTVLGTAAYISPEQAAGEPASPASDVYSFGVILFRMLTGRLPFEARQPLELVRQHRDEVPPAVASLRPDAPTALQALVGAALAKNPAARPDDGAALVARLRSGEPAPSELATQVLRPARPVGRQRPPALLLAGGALLAAAGAALAIVALGDNASTKSGTSEPSVHSATPASTAASTQLLTPPRITSPQAATSAAVSTPAHQASTQVQVTTAPVISPATTAAPATAPATTAQSITTAATTGAATTASTTVTVPVPGG